MAMSAAARRPDPCSCADVDSVTVRHAHFDWTVDFDNERIVGDVALTLKALTDGVDTVMLDAKGLHIERVHGGGTELGHKLTASATPAYGGELAITLDRPLAAGEERVVTVSYRTGARPTAVQFLSAAQTADRLQPFVFSQCQAIHARSMMPCMDSPAVKFTYTAKVRAPKDVVMLMSAVRGGQAADDADASLAVTTFEQKTPVPAYLVALAGGALVCRTLGGRTAVWSEPSLADRAAAEFEPTERMLEAAEQLMGPYRWGRYDLLVLPPSFPYGGMENPCMTFVTPTLLGADGCRVVAHEIAHSWTGNLVTNRHWGEFWLNEGWTVFAERKILARVYSEPVRHLEAFLGWNFIKEAVDEQFSPTHPYTRLVLPYADMAGVDPDDTFSRIPYEKGSALLTHLEQVLGGGAKFEPFIRAYVERFAGQCVTTDEWKDYLYEYFAGDKDKLDGVRWQKWLHAPGVPPNKPVFDESLVSECGQLAHRWIDAGDDQLDAFDAGQFERLNATQKKVVMDALLHSHPPLSHFKLARMDELYRLSVTANSDLLDVWIRLCIASRHEPIVPVALRFVTGQGRMKYCRPIYRALHGWESARPAAVAAFNANRPRMHEIAAAMCAKDLKLA